jgi:hypothetical protein
LFKPQRGYFFRGFGNFSISQGIPIASPFCKGGLRGIFLVQPGLIESLLLVCILKGTMEHSSLTRRRK